MKKIMLERNVIDGLIAYCKGSHPHEGILLLRGKNSKKQILINALVLPPLSVQSETYSSFPIHMLPLDLSIMGTAHSHPNGVLKPSLQDLNNYFGRIMLIVAYPYRDEENIAIFDRDGYEAKYHLI